MNTFIGYDVANLEMIVDHYEAYIIDLWGVIYNGHQVYDSAKDVLRNLVSRGKTIHLITNNPRTSRENARILNGLGLTPDYYSDIISAGQKSLELLRAGILMPERQRPLSTYLIDDIGLCDWIDDANLKIVPDIHTAEMILSIHMDETLYTPTPFIPLFESAIELGIPHICCNPDKYVMKNDVKMARVGVLADLYRALGGTVFEIGKPHPVMFEDIMNLHKQESILLIGDSLVTDITAAHYIGVDSLLVTSGYHQEEFRSASRLNSQRLFKNYGVCPTYVCEYLSW